MQPRDGQLSNPSGAKKMDTEFDRYARRLRAGDYGLEKIGPLLDMAVKENRLEEGEALLASLDAAHPGDDRILGGRVALLLRSAKPERAMALIRHRLARSRVDDEFLRAAVGIGEMVSGRERTPVADPDERICLCMIVRNEALNLARCLNNVLEAVDEIVVVDTGSEDETRTIARIFGAQVLQFQWCDDFAAARNYGLARAAGPWILVLDADELIAPQDLEGLRKLVQQARGRNLAYSLMTRNYTRLANVVGLRANDGRYPGLEAGCGWFPSWKVRLFRKMPAVQFRFPVHERVDPALKEAGVTIEKSEVVIHHYGSLDVTRSAAKAEKYYQLALAKLERLRHDPAALRELAIQAGQLEKWDQAAELWEAFLKLRPDWAEAWVNLAGAHWQMGNYQQAVELAGKALALDKDCREAFFNQALGLLMQARLDEALAILEMLTQRHPGYLAAEFQLAACLAAAGRKQAAARAAARLVQQIGEDVWNAAVGDLAGRMRTAGLEKMAKAVMDLDLGTYPGRKIISHENRAGQLSGRPA